MRRQLVPVLFGASYNPKKSLGSDLVAWWDADSRYWTQYGGLGAMTDDGSGVISSWKDIIAGYDATAATTARPTFSATSFNGAPGVTFDGTANAMTSTTAGLLSALQTAATPNELWALVQQDALVADTSQRYALAYGGNAGTTSRTIGRVVSGGVNRSRCRTGDGASSLAANGSAVNLSTRHVIRWAVGATASASTVDGSADGSLNVVPSTSALRLRIGSNSSTAAAEFWQGIIVAGLIVNALSASKATALQNWLLGRRRL